MFHTVCFILGLSALWALCSLILPSQTAFKKVSGLMISSFGAYRGRVPKAMQGYGLVMLHVCVCVYV